MARSSKITPELVDEILTYKENGLSDKDVCDMVGVAPGTFYKWIKEADTGINIDHPDKPVSHAELKRELRDGLKRAQAAFKAYHIQNISKAAKKSWQASAWMLERMYPKEFGRIERQVALMGEAGKDNGMLEDILQYLGLSAAKSEPGPEEAQDG